MSRKIPASRAKTEEKQDEEGNDVRSSDLAVRGRPDDSVLKEASAATRSPAEGTFGGGCGLVTYWTDAGGR